MTGLRSDDAKERILNTKVDLRLLQMIDERIFDGTIHRKGIDILVDIFKNGLAIWIPAVYAVLTSCADDLRSVMLNPMNPPSFDNGSWIRVQGCTPSATQESGKLRHGEDIPQTSQKGKG